MYCHIKKITGSYFAGATVIDWVEFPKMILNEDAEYSLTRHKWGEPFSFLASEFSLKFASISSVRSNLGKTIREFFEPSTTGNVKFYVWWGDSRNLIYYDGEIVYQSLDDSDTPGEMTISLNVISHETAIFERLAKGQSQRFDGSVNTGMTFDMLLEYYLLPATYNLHKVYFTGGNIKNKIIARLGWNPQVSIPIYNAWVGQLSTTSLGRKSIADVIKGYMKEMGLVMTLRLSGYLPQNNAELPVITLDFTLPNSPANTSVQITKRSGLHYLVNISDKPVAILIFTKYKAPGAEFGLERFGYMLFNKSVSESPHIGFVDVNVTGPLSDTANTVDYQNDYYNINGVVFLKSDLLEINELEDLWTSGGYEVSVSLGRSLVKNWTPVPAYSDSGFNLIAAALAGVELRYLSANAQRACQFKTRYNSQMKLASAVNNFEGKNWWIDEMKVNDFKKEVEMKLIQKNV